MSDQPFTLFGAVSTLEYTQARIRDLYAADGFLNRLQFEGSYDAYVVDRLQGIIDYFKTEYEQYFGMQFPEPAAPCSAEDAPADTEAAA